MNSRDLEIMEEVIEKLQIIDNTYQSDIPPEYIEQIREIWCDMQKEVDLYSQEDEEDIPNLEKDLYYADMQYQDNLERKWGLL